MKNVHELYLYSLNAIFFLICEFSNNPSNLRDRTDTYTWNIPILRNAQNITIIIGAHKAILSSVRSPIRNS